MTELLSLWRFPLDRVGISTAQKVAAEQPNCSVTITFTTDFSAMTIYNYGASKPEPVPGGSSVVNSSALSYMLAKMSAASPIGGLAFIPQAEFPINADSFSVPDQCNIVGSAGGGSAGKNQTPFYHFMIDYNYTDGSIFLKCSGDSTSGGKCFRSLAFFGMNIGGAGDTCIHAGTENCRAINCTFTDIPTAFNAQGDGCMLEQSTIFYAATQTGTKAIIIAGAQCGVLGPAEIDQQSQNPGPANCTAISIEGAEHTLVAEVHLSDWNIGIDFSQAAGAQHTHIRNISVQSWQNALRIQLPTNAGASTAGIKVTSSYLAKSNVTTVTDPVVLIDPQGNSNAKLSDITLLECTVINTAASSGVQYGLQIVGGTNIKIIGGTYSNNGTHGGAGIAITGACGDVQIIGANVQPSYPWSAIQNSQQYGLLVTAAPAGTVYVADCDLTGYGTGQQAVEVTVPLTSGQLAIYNCPGYNDKDTSLNGGVAPTHATSASSCTTPYFGPSVFVFVNPSGQPVRLHVFGQVMSQSFGIIFLPSPYDSFYFETAPSAFSWIGT